MEDKEEEDKIRKYIEETYNVELVNTGRKKISAKGKQIITDHIVKCITIKEIKGEKSIGIYILGTYIILLRICKIIREQIGKPEEKEETKPKIKGKQKIKERTKILEWIEEFLETRYIEAEKNKYTDKEEVLRYIYEIKSNELIKKNEDKYEKFLSKGYEKIKETIEEIYDKAERYRINKKEEYNTYE